MGVTGAAASAMVRGRLSAGGSEAGVGVGGRRWGWGGGVEHSIPIFLLLTSVRVFCVRCDKDEM